MYDPYDNQFYLSHQEGENKTWIIDGSGNLYINGKGSRCFIETPNKDVETTIFFVWNANMENVSILNRSSHSRRYYNDCGFGGYHATIRNNTAYFRKEGLSHPAETSRVKSATISPTILAGQKIGFRFTTKTETGKVRNTISISRDNGSTWKKVTEWLDDGLQWYGLDTAWTKDDVVAKVKACPTVHGVTWTKDAAKKPWLLEELSICLRFDTLPDKLFNNLQIHDVIVRSI